MPVRDGRAQASAGSATAACTKRYRLLITGSREYSDYDSVFAAVGRALSIFFAAADGADFAVTVIHGGARGADRLAAQAAREHGANVEERPADWARHGKSAGFIRNVEMVRSGADLCLAFFQPGAGNRGTAHCAAMAERAGIPVVRIRGNG